MQKRDSHSANTLALTSPADDFDHVNQVGVFIECQLQLKIWFALLAVSQSKHLLRHLGNSANTMKKVPKSEMCNTLQERL